MLTIEKGIPIPATTARKGNNIELLRSMAPGDSVFFDAPIIKKATRFYRVAKHLGVKVLIRREGTGMRMWRMADETYGTAGAVDPARVTKVARKKPLVIKRAQPVPKKVVKGLKAKATPSAADLEAQKKAKASRDKRYRESKKAVKAAQAVGATNA